MVVKLQIFMTKKISKTDYNDTFLAIISFDSALKNDENYYSQMFLKECKYIEKNRHFFHLNRHST